MIRARTRPGVTRKVKPYDAREACYTGDAFLETCCDEIVEGFDADFRAHTSSRAARRGGRVRPRMPPRRRHAVPRRVRRTSTERGLRAELHVRRRHHRDETRRRLLEGSDEAAAIPS